MRLRQRRFSRRTYRNTVAFGAALLAAAALLLIADVWWLATLPGWARTTLGIADAALFFFGGAYVLAGVYGMAQTR
jgi:hypothetical protein